MSLRRPCQLASGSISVQLSLPAAAYLHQQPQPSGVSVAEQVASALQQPLGLPLLQDCAVPGDRVVIVIDPETPALAEIIGQAVEVLQLVGDVGVSLTLLLPPDPSGNRWEPLQASLPEHVRHQAAIHVHDPRDETQRGYLASSASGERVYLNRVLLDADLIVSVSLVGFDGLLGYRGTSSVLYPHFSDIETIRETRAQGHPELTPEQHRPLRDLVNEIGWLLGMQFAIQVVPDADGGVARVLCGAPDQVQQAGQSLLDQCWRILVDEPFELVVVSVPGNAPFAWKQLGTALEMAGRLVESDGRIAVVAQVRTPEGGGAAMLRRCSDPEELLKPLRRDPPEDALEITQLIQAQRKASLFLFSDMPAEIVEELGMLAVGSGDELQRLMDQHSRVIVVPGANFAWCDATAIA